MAGYEPRAGVIMIDPDTYEVVATTHEGITKVRLTGEQALAVSEMLWALTKHLVKERIPF